MKSATLMKSFSFIPRVVRAGVPRRIPLGCRALWSPKIENQDRLCHITMVLDFEWINNHNNQQGLLTYDFVLFVISTFSKNK